MQYYVAFNLPRIHSVPRGMLLDQFSFICKQCVACKASLCCRITNFKHFVDEEERRSLKLPIHACRQCDGGSPIMELTDNPNNSSLLTPTQILVSYIAEFRYTYLNQNDVRQLNVGGSNDRGQYPVSTLLYRCRISFVCCLLLAFLHVSLFDLMMEAVCSSNTSISYTTLNGNISENEILFTLIFSIIFNDKCD
jgi:hypothetical protein